MFIKSELQGMEALCLIGVKDVRDDSNFHIGIDACHRAGNILVHLLPALLTVFLLISGGVRPWKEAKLAFWEAVLPTLLCLAGSVTYHTFMANHQHYYKYLFLDVSLQSIYKSSKSSVQEQPIFWSCGLSKTDNTHRYVSCNALQNISITCH